MNPIKKSSSKFNDGGPQYELVKKFILLIYKYKYLKLILGCFYFHIFKKKFPKGFRIKILYEILASTTF